MTHLSSQPGKTLNLRTAAFSGFGTGALRVLGHAEFFEPVRNLLHRGDQGFATGEPAFRPPATESLHQ